MVSVGEKQQGLGGTVLSGGLWSLCFSFLMAWLPRGSWAAYMMAERLLKASVPAK